VDILRNFNHIGLVFLCLPAFAGEYAVLNNGFRIHADRHEFEGGRVRLFADGGMTELAASEVASIQQEEYTPTALGTAETVVPAPTSAPPAAKDLYADAAKKHGLPVGLIRSLVKAESNFKSDAVSPKGAIGLMQLMPGTARALGADPTVPDQNVDAGTRYLRDLLIKYQASDDQVARAIAAYNAGPGAVDKYKGVPPYPETQNYVRRVLTDYVKTIE
jgi:soluble lytic murein transglycosylase-like protein